MLNQKQKIMAVIGIAIVIIIVGYYYINSTKEVYGNKEVQNFVENNETVVEEEEQEEKEEETILVHITGAVEKNGVVKVKENARINDAIEAAGGITEEADLSDVNLAYIITDGQKIYIPKKADKLEVEKKQEIVTENSGNNIIKGETNAEVGKRLIDINKAGLEELMSLQGIGEATAWKILEYRTVNGRYKTIEDIKNVTGIGDAKFNAIKNFITV